MTEEARNKKKGIKDFVTEEDGNKKKKKKRQQRGEKDMRLGFFLLYFY